MIELQQGQCFGAWTVIRFSHMESGNRPKYLCRCRCGVEKTVFSRSLREGTSNSCGCVAKPVWSEATRRAKLKHGHTTDRSYSPEYAAWMGMKARCYNPSEACFPRYGGRGIVVCDEWRGSFEVFLADMGAKPTRAHSIERKDVNGNYTPDNCCWETQKRQQRNRRNSLIITAFGLNVQINDFCEAVDDDRQLIRTRIQRGWSQEGAILRPCGNNHGDHSGRLPVNLNKLIAFVGAATQTFKQMLNQARAA